VEDGKVTIWYSEPTLNMSAEHRSFEFVKGMAIANIPWLAVAIVLASIVVGIS
jgi:hypothetical protein